MELTDQGGVRITLRPTEYEGPELLHGDGHDWVMIFGEVADKADSWSFQSALLMTSELTELSGWLRGVAAGAVLTRRQWHETNARLLKPASGPPPIGSQVFARVAVSTTPTQG
jgi:hypothetical protein